MRRIALLLAAAVWCSGCVSMMRKRVLLEESAPETKREPVREIVSAEPTLDANEVVVAARKTSTSRVTLSTKRVYAWKNVDYYDHWLAYVDGNISFPLDIPICLGWGLYALASSEYEIALGPIGLIGGMLLPGVSCNPESSSDSQWYEGTDSSRTTDRREEAVDEKRGDDTEEVKTVTGTVRVSALGVTREVTTDGYGAARVPALPFVLEALRRGKTRLEIRAEVVGEVQEAGLPPPGVYDDTPQEPM